MEGIMNLPANVGGATSQDGLDSYAPLIAAQQTARDMGYPRFTRELLAAGSEIDQAEVQEFLQTIRDAGLTSDDVAMMRRVVEAVFGDPNNYLEVRGRLLAEGVPEDILPETFDLEFFVALRMAVEEAENLSQESRPMGQEVAPEGVPEAPIAMAEGGIASPIRNVFNRLQEEPAPVVSDEGRGIFNSKRFRDLRELALKKELESRQQSRQELLDRMRQQYPSLFGSLTPLRMAEGGIVGLPQMTPIAREMAAMGRNGDTMLAHITPQEAMMLKSMGGSGTINPYTGLPEFFIDKIFKGVGKAIKSVARGVKKFAKSTVGRIVLSVALGAFLGPMATGFLSGTMGVTLSAAAATGISAGIGVFGSSLLAGDGFKNSLRNGLTAGALTYGTAGLMGDFSTPAADAPKTFGEGYQQGVSNIKAPFQKAANLVSGPETGVDTASPAISEIGTATEQLASAPPAEAGAFGRYVEPPVDINVQQGLPSGLPQPSAPQLQPPANLGQGLPGGPGYPGGRLAGINVEQGLPSGLPDPASISGDLGRGPNFFDRAVKGAQDVYTDYLSPSRASIQPPSLQDAVAQVKADYVSSGLKVPADDIVMASAKKLVTEQTPGFMAKYGPIAAVAGTTLAATGGLDSLFKAPEQEPGESYEAYMARRQAAEAQFRQERPEFFGSFLASPNQGIMSTQPSYSFQPVYTAARGSGPQGVKDFPRKNGHISGPGTGTSDDIPAMLSDGEFVFTAQSVRNMGGGSRRKGAARMYKMMKMLEGGPVGKTAKA